MAPPHRTESLQKEGRITLPMSAIRKNQISSGCRAAKTYVVPRSILQARLKGRPSKLGSRAKNRKLLECKEETLIKWIYNIEQRGFPPYIIDVRRMAQTLLTRRGSDASATLGKHWVYKFIRQHPDLDARLSRNIDSQQAKNKDPKIISKWFCQLGAYTINASFDFYHILSYSITFYDITNALPMYSIVFYKILLIIKRMTTTTVAYSKSSINM
jgi:hypothetical protein